MNQASAAAQDRRASKLTDVSGQGWWAIAKQTWKEAGEENLGLIASGVAFYAFLAFVPLLTAVVLSYGLVADPHQVANHIAALAERMPQDAASLIGDQLENMVEGGGSSLGFGLLLSLGLALYGAMKGASAIVTALNIVYDVDESRSFLRQTAVALSITFGLVLVFILASVAISALGFLESLLPSLGGVVHVLLQIGMWIGAAAGVSAVIALIYRYAPNRPEAKWRWLTPGSIIATLTWVAATFGFAFYVRNFGSYNATYGSLGAVIVFLTWLYLSAYILLLGGELNQVLERRVGREEALEGGQAAAREHESRSKGEKSSAQPQRASPQRQDRPADDASAATPSLGNVAARIGLFALVLKLLPRRASFR